jgi:hypothetical protein
MVESIAKMYDFSIRRIRFFYGDLPELISTRNGMRNQNIRQYKDQP